MSNLRYQRGAKYERTIMHALADLGWYAVRSAASKGLFDVIAFPVTVQARCPMLIQVKSLREPITAEQWLKRPAVQKELKPFGDFTSWAEHYKVLAVVQPGLPATVKKIPGKKKARSVAVPGVPLRVTLFHVYDYQTGNEKRRKFHRIEIKGVSK